MSDEIGKRIGLLRKKKDNMSQQKLADKIGVSQGLVCQWEKGWGTPTTDIVIKLADVFNVSTDFILRGKTIKEVASEIEKAKFKYDIEKYLAGKYNFSKSPELIHHHHNFLFEHPDFYNDILSRKSFHFHNTFSKENYFVDTSKPIVSIKKLDFMYSPRVYLETTTIEKFRYDFNIVLIDDTKNKNYKKETNLKKRIIGTAYATIELVKDNWFYCGKIGFSFQDRFIEYLTTNRKDIKSYDKEYYTVMQSYYIDIGNLIWYMVNELRKVYVLNNFNGVIQFSQSIDNRILARECQERGEYFVFVESLDIVKQCLEKSPHDYQETMKKIFERKENNGY